MSLVPEQPDNKDRSDEVELSMPEELNINADVSAPKLEKRPKNWETKKPLVSPISDEEKAKFKGVEIPVLADAGSAVDEHIQMAQIASLDITEESVNWYAGLMNGFKSHPAKGLFEDALANPNAHWVDALYHQDQPINQGRPKFNNKGRSSSMSSERLQLSIRSRLGLGSPVQEPMMASGFYATVKPLGEDEIINLWREIIANPVKLGRITHGLLFSNISVFTAREVYMAWARNVSGTTVSDLPLENLADHLDVNDLTLIAHSLITGIYPNGFPLTRSVFYADTGMPKEEISQLIDVRKALVMDSNCYTEEQKAHMAKRIETPTTLKQVKEYREQFKHLTNTVVQIDDEIKIHLHTPSLREYFESGEKWINEITTSVDNALGKSAEINERLPLISKLAKSSRLRQYAHYIKSIQEGDEVYTTRENVDKTLVSLSMDDEISSKIYKAVSDYINQTQVAIIATTSVNEYEDTKSGERWPRLIPLDPISVFFQLVEQKLRGIMSREMEGI